MHCHFDRHVVWGMDTVFIVKDGKDPEAKMMRPPKNMPKCWKKQGMADNLVGISAYATSMTDSVVAMAISYIV